MVARSRRPARGEIWLVDFNPVVGSEQAGIRPALVFSSDRYQRAQGRLIIVLPMTTRIRSYPFHLAVQAEETGLPQPGAIMCDQVRVVSTERLVRRGPSGRITAATMARVEDLFRILFELP
jgi:mRNA interferase MazF